MSDVLQEFDYKASLYSRPNQTWVCGRAVLGEPCAIGPDSQGKCRATFECDPARKGDRYVCTRTELNGGRCADGPTVEGQCCRAIVPCQPRRSWRARRRVLGRWVTATVVGFLLIFIAGSSGPAFFTPGDLTFQHSQVGECTGCHEGFGQGPLGWVHAAFAESNAIFDSKRCIACHNFGRKELLPHSLALSETARMTENTAAPSSQSRPWALAVLDTAVTLPMNSRSALPCLTCHQEHRGQNADLTAIADGRCMVCHKAVFNSFSDGHPDFRDYPYKRRTRFAFDHTSHIGKHFRAKESVPIAPKECKNCHSPDIRGRLMLVKDFKTVCAACHLAQIEGAGRATAKGIAVFGVPGLDVESLRDKGVAIGQWPEGPDGEITDFVEFLLSDNANFVAARNALDGIDLMNLADINAGQVKAVSNFAWAVKDLLFDLTTQGAPAFQTRLESALGRKLTVDEVGRLFGLLQADAMRAAQIAWFPSLLREIPRHRDGETVAMPAVAEAVGDEKSEQKPGPEPETGGSDDILGGDKSGGLSRESKGAGSDILGDARDGAASGSDDILGGENKAPAGKSDDILGGEKEAAGKDSGDILGGDKEGGAEKPEKAGALSADGGQGGEAEIIGGEDWSTAGGWYRDDFTLRYRPSGHADIFIRSWLDVSGSAVTGSGKQAAARILARLSAKDSPGLCVKCHSLDQDGETVRVNWRSAKPRPDYHKATQFSHTAHFPLLNEKGCLTCHTVNRKAEFAAGYKDRNPMTFASNFKPISRQTCANCHTKEKAGDTCLTCHNYHMGLFPPAVASTAKMSESIAK